MTSTEMHKLAGIEQDLALTNERCEVLPASIQAAKIQIKPSRPGSAACQDRFTAIKTSSTSANQVTDEDSCGTDANSEESLLLPPLPSPAENRNEQRTKSGEVEFHETNSNADTHAALQKLQDFFLGFPTFSRMASFSRSIYQHTSPASEICSTGTKEQTATDVETLSEEHDIPNQFAECDETSFNTEDTGCNVKDDFLSADERPPSSCRNILSENENNNFTEESLKNVPVSSPITARFKVMRSRVTKERKLQRRARPLDSERGRAHTARQVRMPRAGNLNPGRSARSANALARGTLKPTRAVRNIPESSKADLLKKEDMLKDRLRRHQVRNARLKSLSRHKQREIPPNCILRRHASTLQLPSKAPGNKSHEETFDASSDSNTIVETCTPMLTIRPKNQALRANSDGRKEVKQNNSIITTHSSKMMPNQGCCLLDEASSTNHLIGGSTFIDDQLNQCSPYQSTLGQSTGISLVSSPIIDVSHSYERPTLSSKLKRVERKISIKDIDNQSTRRKGHPFVVATATSPSHNVNLSSRDSLWDTSRPPSRATTEKSGGDTKPLSYSRQIHSVVARLRDEMIQLATKRAIVAAACKVPVPGTNYRNPSLLTSADNGIVRAKLKLLARAGKKKKDSEEYLHKIDHFDQKLQDKEDEIFIIVTLCEEVQELRQKLKALGRRLSLHSITNVQSTSTPTGAEETQLGRERGPRQGQGRQTSRDYRQFRFRGSHAAPARQGPQLCYRSKSAAGFTSNVVL